MGLWNLVDVPMTIILGIMFGTAAGMIFYAFFEAKYRKG